MKLTTILFDLDGTLLPLDQDVFIQTYFDLLSRECGRMGLNGKTAIQGVWAGTEAMIKNDGRALNRERFWDAFAALMGEDVRELEPHFDRFYDTVFHEVKAVTGPTPMAAECVRILKEKGYRLVLSTNPLFPLVGVHARLSWAGIDPAQFLHITHYKNSHYCKPNPAYFQEILDTIGADPRESIVVGNDAREDMSAAQLGCATFLVTDCLEHEGAEPPPRPFGGLELTGSLADFKAWIGTLRAI